MPITVTTRVKDELVQAIDHVAGEEAIERSAVIRKFLIKSVQEWKVQKFLDEYEQGKITLWQAAKRCDLSLWEMMEETKKRRVHLPYGIEELKEDLQVL